MRRFALQMNPTNSKNPTAGYGYGLLYRARHNASSERAPPHRNGHDETGSRHAPKRLTQLKKMCSLNYFEIDPPRYANKIYK